MANHPILSNSLPKPVFAAITVCTMIVVIMIVTGCTTKPVIINQSITTPSVIVTLATPKSIALYKVTIAQPNNSNSDLILMDSDVYNVGEVINFSLITDRQVIPLNDCDLFSFRVFFRNIDGSWKELPEPFKAYFPYIAPQPASTAFPGPGHAIPEYHLITTNWTPGNYKIQSDCLNASHEFIMRNLSSSVPATGDSQWNDSPAVPILTPHPTITGSAFQKQPGYEAISSDIRELLNFWNERMNWNLSAGQIDRFASDLERGVLKKYLTNPVYPHVLYITDKRQFQRELGEALGYNESETEDFVRALKEYDIQYWQMTDCRDFVNNSPCPQHRVPINFSLKPRL